MKSFLKALSILPGLIVAFTFFPFGYVAGWVWIGLKVGYNQAVEHLEMKLP